MCCVGSAQFVRVDATPVLRVERLLPVVCIFCARVHQPLTLSRAARRPGCPRLLVLCPLSPPPRCVRVWVCIWGRSYSSVGGGFKNVGSAYNSFVGGGGARTADNLGGTVASGRWSAVLGGSFNTAKGV